MTTETTDEITRLDTWVNFATQLGTFLDKSEAAAFMRRPRIDDATLDALYDEDAMIARVVDMPADEMTRAGFDLKSPGDGFDWSTIATLLDAEPNALATIGDAIRWSRLYAGTLLVFEVDDGRKPELALDLGSAKVLIRVFVVEAPYAIPSAGSIDDPEVWEIGEGGIGPRKRVHKSRVVRFDGVRTSPGARRRFGRNGWGPSVVDRILAGVQRLGTVMGYMANIMHEMSLPVVQIDGLRKMLLAEGPGQGPAGVRAVLQSLKESIDILHMFAIDGKDTFQDVSRDVRGLVEVEAKFEAAVAWMTDMPAELLFNTMEGGLNTGALSGPIRNWYDRIAKKRRDVVTPAVRKWIEILGAVHHLSVPTVYVVDHKPLWQPTAKEAAETALTWAQADQINHTMGAIDEDEIRHARFVATTDGGFAVDEDEAEEPAVANVLALAPAPELEAEGEGETTPPPAIDIDGVLKITKAASMNEIPRDGAIALLSIAFPPLRPVVASMVPPPPAPAAPVDPNAVPDELEPEGELMQADYDPPAGETLLPASEVGARFNVSAAVIRGMHKRGAIGGWKPGGRWRYSPTEVAKAAHRPKTPPGEPPAGTGEGGPPPPPLGATP